MVLKLYILPGSPPCRAVLITAKALGLTLDISIVIPHGDSVSLANLQKINPRRTAPTLDDDGKILCDSHAIICYLVEKYSPGNLLYPPDLYKRALVNDKLFFNNGVLFAYLHMLLMSFITREITSVPEKQAQHVIKAYDMVSIYLNEQDWMCGDEITIADIALFTTITALHRLVHLEETKYTNIVAWIKRTKELPYMLEDEQQLQYFNVWFTKLQSGTL